jgi:hypothetical protein
MFMLYLLLGTYVMLCFTSIQRPVLSSICYTCKKITPEDGPKNGPKHVVWLRLE